MHLYVIAGHGAGDPGACGHGYTEAEQVRKLAKRIKALGGDAVTLHDLDDNAYRSEAIAKLTVPKDWQIVELHMDGSTDKSDHGGHVIVDADLEADKYDLALESAIAGMFPGRAVTLSYRNDLQNPNLAAAYGRPYRLVENGYISNKEDADRFQERLDDLALAYLRAFGIKAAEPTEYVVRKATWLRTKRHRVKATRVKLLEPGAVVTVVETRQSDTGRTWGKTDKGYWLVLRGPVMRNYAKPRQ